MNKLQVNHNGAWRDVLRFEDRDANKVKAAARALAKIAGTWRVVNAAGVAQYLDTASGTWTTLDQRREQVKG